MPVKRPAVETGSKDATDGKLEGFTPTELHLIVMGFQCHDAGKIEIEKFAGAVGYDNQGSARVRWNYVRRKMEKYFTENKKSDVELAIRLDKAASTGPRAAGKRKQGSADTDTAAAGIEGANSDALAPKKRRVAKVTKVKSNPDGADEGNEANSANNNDTTQDIMGEVPVKEELAASGNPSMGDLEVNRSTAAGEHIRQEEHASREDRHSVDGQVD